MTSEERREARYRRRVARRELRRAERDRDLTLETVADMNNLYKAAWQAARGVRWKASVQCYLKDVLINVYRSRRDLLSGVDVRRGFYKFDLWERGKLRHITSVHFRERVPHKSLNQNVLMPSISPSMVPGNTANRVGMGNVYAAKLLKRQLVRHRDRYGTDGYVLLFDFSDYFASIPHGVAYEMLAYYVRDERCLRYARDFVGGPDERGLGLGSEPNQTVAVALPSVIDHHIVECFDVEAYGRYMDDGYVICNDKETLWRIASEVEWMACELGLQVNVRKTRVVRLTSGFTFLKKRFFYGRGDRVVVKPCREAVTRERRKLKRLHALYEEGVLTLEHVSRHYQSWRGGMVHFDAHRTVLRMDALYRSLFGGAGKEDVDG